MKRIAILAGGGRLPLILADSIAASGGRAHIVAVRGEAGPEVETYPHTWVTWGSVNAILATLKRESDGTMMIAGTVSRPDLRRLKPDFGLIRYLPQVLAMLKGGDDAVLTRLIRFFEGQGLTVKGVSDVAPQLLAEPGTLGAPAPQSTPAADDTALGFRVLDALADLDVGQAIAVEGEGGGVLTGIYPAGAYTHGLSSKLIEQGAPRCPVCWSRGQSAARISVSMCRLSGPRPSRTWHWHGSARW